MYTNMSQYTSGRCLLAAWETLVACSAFPTCGQEAMSRQQQLRRNLHFGFALVLKSREVPFVFIGRHFFPGSVVG